MAKLIICIDGLGYDLISKENTPFLHSFGKKNGLSRLKTLFAFTGIEYAFFTGKTPDKTGIWLEFEKNMNSIFKTRLIGLFSFNKKLRNYVAGLVQLLNKRTWISGLHNIPQKFVKYFDSSAKIGLWKTDYFQKKQFAFYKWPFFVTKNGSENMKIIMKYEDDDDRLKRLLNCKNKQIYYTQLMEIDKAIHKYGKKSSQVKIVLRKIDRILANYVSDFLAKNESNKVLIWSDHGFADVKTYINLEKILPKREDYIYFIAGTTASFWFKNTESKKEVEKILKESKFGHILDSNTAKKYKIPMDKKYGDIILYLDKGKYFFPNFYQKDNDEKFLAMHGYPEDKELDGILIPCKKKVLKINESGVRNE